MEKFSSICDFSSYIQKIVAKGSVEDRKSLRHNLTQAANALPEQQKIILSLKWTEAMSEAEIASLLGMEEKMVRRIHHIAVVEHRLDVAGNFMRKPQ